MHVGDESSLDCVSDWLATELCPRVSRRHNNLVSQLKISLLNDPRHFLTYLCPLLLIYLFVTGWKWSCELLAFAFFQIQHTTMQPMKDALGIRLEIFSISICKVTRERERSSFGLVHVLECLDSIKKGDESERRCVACAMRRSASDCA